jgi:PKD repeat protein
MNQDGKMDVLSASGDGASWWRNMGDGSFERNDIGDLTGAWFVHGADVDGDNDIDVMAASPAPEAHQIKLWINNGASGWKPEYILPLFEAEAVTAADLNGDGIKEILGVSWETFMDSLGSDLVYFQDYRDTTKVTVDGNLLGAHCVATADFDNDGDLDIFGSGAGVIRIYVNYGDGSFSAGYPVTDDGALGFDLADLDRDGDLDIVAQARNKQEVRWYEYISGFDFEGHVVGTDIGECWSVHAADLDGDGDLDITAASTTLNTVKAYINNGSQKFSEMTVAEDFSYARYEYPVDIDDDGDADIVAVSANTRTIVWFESVAPRRALRLTSPTGGETWIAGAAKDITWTSEGDISAVTITLSTDAGATWQIVAANVPNTGAYKWTVPNAVSDKCLIRIAVALNNKIADASDSTFTIVTPSLAIASPNGGENWVAGTSQNINWTTIGSISHVKLEYALDDNMTWRLIAEHVRNSGSFSWTVPDTASDACRVRISDDADGEPLDVSDDAFRILAKNRPPFAHAGGPYNGARNQAITFSASQSYDPDGDALSYEWAFGDGQTGSGMQASHVYSALNVYQVTLTVRDGRGGEAVASTEVKIQNRAPLVAISAGEVEVIGACQSIYPITFTIDQAQDQDGVITAYDWDFGDGGPHGNSSSSLSHDFQVPGAYTIVLTVTDNDGGVGVDSVRVSLTANQPPVAAFKVPKDTLVVNTVVNFDASASSDAEGRIASYSWDFGDGAVITGTEPKVAHVFQSTRQFNVLLLVSDSCGVSSTVSKTLQIVQPSAVAQENRQGLPASFVLAQSFPNPIALNGGKLALTRMAFQLPKAAEVRLSVYNIFGQHVRTLLRNHFAPGHYEATWDLRDDRGESVSVGIYFYRLQAGDYSATRKLVITK